MKLRNSLITCAMAGLLAITCVQRTVAADSAPKRIDVVAKRFTYSPADITLKKGEPVVLVLATSDVPHGLRFKELNLDTKISKGKPSELALTPMQTGDFVGHCSIFCGSGHGSMTLTIHVTE